MSQIISLKQREKLFTLTIILLWGLSVAAFNQSLTIIHEQGKILTYSKFWWAELFGWIGVILLTILSLLSIFGKSQTLLAKTDRIIELFELKTWLSAFLLFFVVFAYGTLFIAFAKYLANSQIRLWIYTISTLASTVLFKAIWKEKTLPWAVLFSGLLFAFLTYAFSYLSGVSNYPFSLAWSETSRYYHASLYLDQLVYGIDLPLPHRDFSRYLMQAVPYLIANSELWMHRLWQALMRGLLPLPPAYLLAKHIKIENRLERLLFTIWGALFLMQAPVFYAMLVVVILMFAWFKSEKFLYSLMLVSLVSVWAGITRINWIPMPGLIAALFYFLEKPLKGDSLKSKFQYLLPPFVWFVVGGLVGLASQRIYEANSGLDPAMFSTTFTSDLLWYRLLPNVSYRLGVLPGTLIVSLPIISYLILVIIKNKKAWHGLRLLGIFAIILGLFLGGLLVSVKIGGGTNLHNLDGYITAIFMAAAFTYYNKFTKDHEQVKGSFNTRPLLIAILTVPIFFALLQKPVWINSDLETVDINIQKIQRFVNFANQEEGEVLFIAERQLITFGIVERAALVHDYEKIVLMEMALGGNQIYLDQFEEDLRNQRFAVIVTDIIARYYKEPGIAALAEENNVHVDQVLRPIMCYYESVRTLRDVGVEIWVPKSTGLCP